MRFHENYNTLWTDDSIRYIATPSPLAKKAYFYVQEAGFFKTLPNYYTERAHLSSYLITYIIDGQGTLNYQGKEYTLKKNHLFWIDCMNHHFYTSDNDNPMVTQWVHYNGASSAEYYNHFINNSPPVLKINKDDKLLSDLKEILNLHQNNTINKELICSNLVLSCITEIMLNLTTSKNDNSGTGLMNKISWYLDNHFNETISLDMLSMKFGISKYYLITLFKKYYGATPIEYLINTRMTYSKNLLQFTNVPISEVASEVGIYNVSHYIKLFKKRENMTPKQYRNIWQDANEHTLIENTNLIKSK